MERPLKLAFQVTGERLALLDEAKPFQKLDASGQAALRRALQSLPTVKFTHQDKFTKLLNKALKAADLKISAPVNFPPLHTQRAIADFLDRETARIDQLIEKKQRLVELLEEKESTSTQWKLIGGNFSSTKRPTSVAWLPKIPAHWKVMKLRHLVRIRTGGKDTKDRVDNGSYPFFVRSMNVERIDSFSFDEEAVLTSGDGAGVGVVFHHINCKFDLHQRMYAFTDFKYLSGAYFYRYLKSFFKLQMSLWSAKSTVDSVRMPFLKTMDFAIPPLEEQTNILQAIEKESGVIAQVMQKNTNLHRPLARIPLGPDDGCGDRTD